MLIGLLFIKPPSLGDTPHHSLWVSHQAVKPTVKASHDSDVAGPVEIAVRGHAAENEPVVNDAAAMGPQNSKRGRFVASKRWVVTYKT